MNARAAEPTTLDVHGLRFRYDRGLVLADIELSVRAGEWVALLGPNASGKTTLLKCVGGLLVPMTGDIRICGLSLRDDPRGCKRRLGFGSSTELLPELLTGRQCLEIYAAAKGLLAIDAELLALSASLRFDPMLDVFVGAYSLGTRQKLSVLLALLGDPSLVVLDEAFNGLDPASSLTLKEHLRKRVTERRCSVLLATHALDVVERYADRAALLLNGHIAHTWNKDELTRLRGGNGEGLEAAIAAVALAE